MEPVVLKEVKYYFDKVRNEIVFDKWFLKLERQDKIIIKKRLFRLSDGNYGDYKSVGNNILELRFKQGFRIYFTEVDNTIILLFCGGDKSSQKKDIEKAKEYKAVLDRDGLDGCVK